MSAEVEQAVAAVLAEQMGCGAGELVMGQIADPDSGDAMPAPVGQMCKSNAHNHAYWASSCEFAERLAAALAPLLAAERARALDEAAEEIEGDPYSNEIARWLRARADRERGEATT